MKLQIEIKEDKYLKKPAQRKFSLENFKQKQQFSQNQFKILQASRDSGVYDLDKIIHTQLSDEKYLSSIQTSARIIQQERRKIQGRYGNSGPQSVYGSNSTKRNISVLGLDHGQTLQTGRQLFEQQNKEQARKSTIEYTNGMTSFEERPDAEFYQNMQSSNMLMHSLPLSTERKGGQDQSQHSFFTKSKALGWEETKEDTKSKEEMSDYFVLPSITKDVIDKDWLIIDPYSSLNAMHITNWKQDDDIKLMIKLKLNGYGYMFDIALERKLENYIKLKQKQENQKQLLKKGKLDRFLATSQICRDLTKFMKNNQNAFIREFQPAHKKYNTKNWHSGIMKSQSQTTIIPMNQYEVMKDLKKSQMADLRKKTVIREKLPEEVYGLNMTSPIKKTHADKEFEVKLKRHLIRGKAERLAGSIDQYFSQKNERQEYFDQYSPSKLKVNNSVLLQRRLEDFNYSRNESHDQIMDSIISRPSPFEKRSKSDFNHIKIQTKNLSIASKYQSEANISEEDLKVAIKKFFDDLEKNGDKQSKILLSNKINEIVNDNDGNFQRKNLDYIQSLDLKTHQYNSQKKLKKRLEMQKEMQKIYENTPYAFEACRLSRILEPKKWFMP